MFNTNRIIVGRNVGESICDNNKEVVVLICSTMWNILNGIKLLVTTFSAMKRQEKIFFYLFRRQK